MEHETGRRSGESGARLPSGRMRRSASLARLSAGSGAEYLYRRLRSRGAREDWEPAFHAATAQRVLDLLGSMKGAAMKLGQIASFVDLDLPPELREVYQQRLADLREAAPPMAPGEVSRVITEQFAAPPEAVFADWDPEPLAAASIGQVHRARLPEGQAVAVKVQYPDIAEAVEADLDNAATLRPLLRLISPNLEIEPLLTELRARVREELDYQREAEHQRAFAAHYAGHPFIRIPAVFPAYCRPRVLTSELATGAAFSEMLAASDQAARDRYGEILFRFAFGSLHRFGLFNADPHPGNYRFPADGSVVFLDFGSVKRFEPATRERLQAQLRAVMDGDADRLLELLTEAAFIPAGQRPNAAALLEWFRLFNAPVAAEGEWTYSPEFAREVIRSTTDLQTESAELLRHLNLPADYLLLNRIQWGVNSLLGQLRATGNWRAITEELMGARPPATALGAAEQRWREAAPDQVA